MIGQGSPRSSPIRNSVCHCTCSMAWAVLICWFALLVCVGHLTAQDTSSQGDTAIVVSQQDPMIGQTAFFAPDPITENASMDSVRLRLTWGGGDPQRWQGRIQINQGNFSQLIPLALTADAPGSVLNSGAELIINHWSPTNYGGADVTVNFDSAATLLISLDSGEPGAEKFERRIDLESLMGPDGVHHDLDPSGTRLSIMRVPGDTLPVQLKREHLVFRPGEAFEIGVRVNRTELISRTANCRLSLTPNKGDGQGERWQGAIQFETDQRGSAPTQWIRVPIPMEEGVFDLQIELESAWYQATLRSNNSQNRRVQFVVVSDQPPATNEFDSWNSESRIDPSQENTNLLAFAQFPISNAWGRTVGNDQRRVVQKNGVSLLELSVGGWQAMPLDIKHLDRPYRVEIEFDDDQPTSIGFSLLQPDASGQISVYGSDSGVFVPNSFAQSDPTAAIHGKHEIVFWPRHRRPYLLIANRSSNRPARIASVEVFSGPERLPSAHSHETATSSTDKTGGREFLAFLESPLFAKLFDAREHFDNGVNQPLDDWQSFYEGADRFVQYLKSNGYTGAFVTVACDGSTIYPSSILTPSPKFDSGVFHSTGQDPIRKDVLEMLFRMFDREGLRLVPVLTLTAPLPGVEASRLNSDLPEKFGLVDFNQAGLPISVRSGLPIYNPLNHQVQKTIVDVVAEIASRYQHVGSFDGVAITCRPDTCTLLPGRQWCYDPITVLQFFQSQPDIQQPTSWAETQQVLLSSHQQRWVEWRLQQMSQWYSAIHQSLQAVLPSAKLYIAPVDLYRNPELAAALSPTLHSAADFKQQMMHVGFDAELFGSTEGLELLKPHRVSPGESLAANRVDWMVRSSRQADRFFIESGSSGDLFSHRVSWAHFKQLEDENLFGKQRSPIMRLQPLAPAGQFNRQRFLESLRKADAPMMIDGGWTLLTGQENQLDDLIQIFSRLPRQTFNDVPLVNPLSQFANSSLPVVVRQYHDRSQSYCYLVNASIWPIEVELALAPSHKGEQIQFESFSERTFEFSSDSTTARVKLPPLSICGGQSAQRLEISNFQFELPQGSADLLRKQIYALQAKLRESTKHQPLGRLPNPGFELNEQPSLSSWDVGNQATSNVRLDTNYAHSGRVSLKLQNTNEQPVWIRSNSFEIPTTGRLSMTVWLRTDDPDQQPPLRLSVEGKNGETNYYRFGAVGALSQQQDVNHIGKKWQRFAVHFDDLPIEKIENLRIGFDLMGPGSVYVDDIQLLDRWFDDNDAKAITQRIASCGPLLSNPATYEQCRLLMQGYWLQFLDQNYLQVPSAQDNPKSNQSNSDANQEARSNEADSKSKNMFRRFRKFGSNRKQTIR